MSENQITTWPLTLLAALTAEQIAQCHNEGQRVGGDGRQAHDCPYDAETAEALCWLEGWRKS